MAYDDFTAKMVSRVHELENALTEKDAEIIRWKSLSRDEHVRFLAESKDNLLQQYVNLTQMYGEQKHEIRRLLAAIAEKDREIQQIREHVIKSRAFLASPQAQSAADEEEQP